MKKYLFMLASVGLVIMVGLFAGCSNDQAPIIGSAAADAVYVGSAEDNEACFDLIAGQNTLVGELCATIVDEELCITYQMNDGYAFSQTHLWVGENIADMPHTPNGTPIPGQFPYSQAFDPAAMTWTVCIPIEDLGGEPYVCNREFHIAAHAVVGTETVWSFGTPFRPQGGRWGWYSTIMLVCDDIPPPPPPPPGEGEGCETAFAFGGNQDNCFLNHTFNRWGWTNPLVSGTYDLYAGAGQCDLETGELAGTLTVDYNAVEGTVHVEYQLTGDWCLTATQLYVGNGMFPIHNGNPTVAPGQYGNVHGEVTGTFDEYHVSGIEGDNLWFIAHAVVCACPDEE